MSNIRSRFRNDGGPSLNFGNQWEEEEERNKKSGNTSLILRVLIGAVIVFAFLYVLGVFGGDTDPNIDMHIDPSTSSDSIPPHRDSVVRRGESSLERLQLDENDPMLKHLKDKNMHRDPNIDLGEEDPFLNHGGMNTQYDERGFPINDKQPNVDMSPPGEAVKLHIDPDDTGATNPLHSDLYDQHGMLNIDEGSERAHRAVHDDRTPESGIAQAHEDGVNDPDQSADFMDQLGLHSESRYEEEEREFWANHRRSSVLNKERKQRVLANEEMEKRDYNGLRFGVPVIEKEGWMSNEGTKCHLLSNQKDHLIDWKPSKPIQCSVDRFSSVNNNRIHNVRCHDGELIYIVQNKEMNLDKELGIYADYHPIYNTYHHYWKRQCSDHHFEGKCKPNAHISFVEMRREHASVESQKGYWLAYRWEPSHETDDDEDHSLRGREAVITACIPKGHLQSKDEYAYNSDLLALRGHKKHAYQLHLRNLYRRDLYTTRSKLFSSHRLSAFGDVDARHVDMTNYESKDEREAREREYENEPHQELLLNADKPADMSEEDWVKLQQHMEHDGPSSHLGDNGLLVERNLTESEQEDFNRKRVEAEAYYNQQRRRGHIDADRLGESTMDHVGAPEMKDHKPLDDFDPVDPSQYLPHTQETSGRGRKLLSVDGSEREEGERKEEEEEEEEREEVGEDDTVDDTVLLEVGLDDVTDSKHDNTIPADHTGERKERRHAPLNVLTVFIDSLSHAHFLRALPKTYELLQSLDKAEEPHALFEFNRYGVLGEDTETFLSAFFGSVDKVLTPQDLTWLWQLYQARGYVTSYLEEECPLNKHTLSRLLAGNEGQERFTLTKDQAEVVLQLSRLMADHTVSELMCPIQELLQTHHGFDELDEDMCFGGKKLFEHLFQYTQQIYTNYDESVGKFSFLNLREAHQPGLDRVAGMDLHLSSLIDHITQTDSNTMIVLVSDHGLGHGEYFERNEAAKLEYKTPALFAVLPQKFLSLYPGLEETIKGNQNSVISAYDLHSTLRHVLTYPHSNIYTKIHEWENQGSVWPGRSLLEPIELERTCESAGIPEELCVCNDFKTVAVTDSYFRNLAEHALFSLNDLTSAGKPNSPCSKLDLVELLEVKRPTVVDHSERVYFRMRTSTKGGGVQDFTIIMEESNDLRGEAEREEEERKKKKGATPIRELDGIMRVAAGGGLTTEGSHTYLKHPHIMLLSDGSPALIEYWNNGDEKNLLIDWMTPNQRIVSHDPVQVNVGKYTSHQIYEGEKREKHPEIDDGAARVIHKADVGYWYAYIHDELSVIDEIKENEGIPAKSVGEEDIEPLVDIDSDGIIRRTTAQLYIAEDFSSVPRDVFLGFWRLHSVVRNDEWKEKECSGQYPSDQCVC